MFAEDPRGAIVRPNLERLVIRCVRPSTASGPHCDGFRSSVAMAMFRIGRWDLGKRYKSGLGHTICTCPATFGHNGVPVAL
jgi:hypothetical protein